MVSLCEDCSAPFARHFSRENGGGLPRNGRESIESIYSSFFESEDFAVSAGFVSSSIFLRYSWLR